MKNIDFDSAWKKESQVFRSPFLKSLIENKAQQFSPKAKNFLEVGSGPYSVLEEINLGANRLEAWDVSNVAIEKAQLRQGSVTYRRRDIFESENEGGFDMIIDGHLLHYFTHPYNQEIYLKRIKNLLNTDGLFILETMVSSKIDHLTQNGKVIKKVFSPLEFENLVKKFFLIKYLVYPFGLKFDLSQLIDQDEAPDVVQCILSKEAQI